MNTNRPLPAALAITIPLVALLALAALPGLASAQGTYTSTQAEAGEVLYNEACAVCHLEDFQGSFEAPELAGPNFRNIWGGRPIGDHLELISTTMPPGEIGSLSDGEKT